MSMLSSIKDKNGNVLVKSTTSKAPKNPSEPKEKARQEINNTFGTIEKKFGVKVNANITKIKTSSDANIVEAYKIVSKPIKANEKVGKNVISVPFYKVYELKLFVEETNVCESYEEVLQDGTIIKHSAKDELKAQTKVSK